MGDAARSIRLEVRLAPEEKELVERATALGGSSAAGFVRSVVLAAAREAVEKREAIELTAEGSRVFVEALVEPPEPDENLRALLARRAGGTGAQAP